VQVASASAAAAAPHAGRWLTERAYAGHFDTQRRAEEVPVHEYVALAGALQARP